ncbi:MAG: hypothetical protein WCT28_03865 [Patescibacteria group bacterium]
MILLHRITPFAIGATSMVSFALLILLPWFGLKALLPCGLLLVLLHARLLLWEFRRPAFWVFLCTPMALWLSSMVFFFFLEDMPSKWIVAVAVSALIGLYTENCFAFYHLPSAYQAYALENLSLVIYVLSAFFFTSGAFGSQLFLLLPTWIPMVLVFISVLFATTAVFWVSKIGFETGRPYAMIGAILFAELYATLAMLPTSFVTNAAVFAVFLYSFLMISRANVLERMTRGMMLRTMGFVGVMLLIILLSARWF